MYQFNAIEAKNACVQWIRDWASENAKGCHILCGLSGGKDSTVTAALCVEAIGKDRVLGVFMPNGHQSDIADSYHVADFLDIKAIEVNIEDMVYAFRASIMSSIITASADSFLNETPALEDFYDSVQETSQMITNLPPRIRMTTLYAIAQMLPMGGRVVNTCNLSEDYLGFSTIFGDAAGDFSPLASFTSEEVSAIGEAIGLPHDLVYKTPSDGLTGKTDEDSFGFSYAVLNRYIRTGTCEDEEIKRMIDERHNRNLFKMNPMPRFQYDPSATL